MLRADERGLSTLEWILLVAAVGGLATIGVIVVRDAVNDTDDRTQTQAELAGEAGALRVLQSKVNQVMTSLRGIGRFGSDADRFNVCLGVTGSWSSAQEVARQKVLLEDQMLPLQEKHQELYSFHPVSVDLVTAEKFPILYRGDWKLVWCRVQSKVSGVCASIADETPVSNPPNDGYRDTNMYRTARIFFKATAPDTSHNYPLSSTFCKGRV